MLGILLKVQNFFVVVEIIQKQKQEIGKGMTGKWSRDSAQMLSFEFFGSCEVAKTKNRNVFYNFTFNLTILVHGKVSDDDRCGVRWRDEGYSRGGLVPTWHWDRVARAGATNGVRVVVLHHDLPTFGLHWRRGRRGGSVVRVRLLQLQRCDVDNGVRVDFALRGRSRNGSRRILIFFVC